MRIDTIAAFYYKKRALPIACCRGPMCSGRLQEKTNPRSLKEGDCI